MELALLGFGRLLAAPGGYARLCDFDARVPQQVRDDASAARLERESYGSEKRNGRPGHDHESSTAEDIG